MGLEEAFSFKQMAGLNVVMLGDIYIFFALGFTALAILFALFRGGRSQSARYAIGAFALLFILAVCLVAKQFSSYAGEPNGMLWPMGDGMMVILSSLAALLLVIRQALPAMARR